MAQDDVAMLLEALDSTPRPLGPDEADPQAPDAFADAHAAAAWLDRWQSPSTPADVQALRRVRDLLQQVVRGACPPADLAEFVADVQQLPTFAEGHLHWRLTNADNAPARLVLAWAQLDAESPGRLRPCANDVCGRFLLDRTRANTARWCSMSRCGNRTKVSRHRARAAENAGNPERA